jgi:membrane dipeptidase
LIPGNDHGDVPTDLHAYASGKSQMAYYHMLETMGEVNLLKFQKEFKDHMDLWLKEDDHMDSPVGMVLGMEGADSITTPDQLQEWYDGGLRLISLSHYGVSRYSHGTGTGTEGGLVGSAKELLQEMDSLNMILDVSHTSDESVRQELEIFEGPVIATHQNCRSITPGERQFPDHQIKSVIERGGVIGHSMDTYMLWSKEIDWSNIPPARPFPKDEVTLDNYVDHIDYVCQLAGNSLHAAIGGDTDGQGGMIGAPYEIDTVADYQFHKELQSYLPDHQYHLLLQHAKNYPPIDIHNQYDQHNYPMSLHLLEKALQVEYLTSQSLCSIACMYP